MELVLLLLLLRGASLQYHVRGRPCQDDGHVHLVIIGRRGRTRLKCSMLRDVSVPG